MSEKRILYLFDVDGTLTHPRNKITDEMKEFLLERVCPIVEIALVGGSDISKITEQMGGFEVLSKIPYVYSENGLVVYKNGVESSKKKIQDHISEEILQKFINFSLNYMSKIVLPVKRGTFIEFRTGLINICPVGRGCSQSERDQFEEYDKIHKIREKFIDALKEEFPDLGLVYSIGGQISFDVFPVGWDKTYCLSQVKVDQYKEIHFFGDKTDKGGNDYEIYNSPLVIGHKAGQSQTMCITGMNAGKEAEEKLREAACFGDLILLKELIFKGVNVNSRNGVNGWTALHWAACRNNVEAVMLLLDSGADSNCLTFKGDSASSLSSSDEIQSLLGRDPRGKKHEDLSIVPNYIRNPPLPCVNINNRLSNKSLIPTYTEDDLVLKVRLAESTEPDFIEVEVLKSELTFEKLKKICCQELEIELSSVSKIRKLPNSIIRNDKDVKRLKEFEELEIVKVKL